MRITKFILTTVFAILLILGCNDGLQNNINVSQVTVSLNGNFRAILPDLGTDGFSKIEISAESTTGADPIAPVEIDLDTGTGSLLVPYGDWNIIATAYLKVGEADYEAVKDSVPLTVSEPAHSVTILLDTPVPGGEGTFAYNIEFALGTTVSMRLESWPLDTDSTTRVFPVTESNKIEEEPIPTGFYFLTVEAVVDGKSYYRDQIVHIYHGRTTTVTYSFLYIEQIIVEGNAVVHYYPTMEISPGGTHDPWNEANVSHLDGSFTIRLGGIRYSFDAITNAGYSLDDYDFFEVEFELENANNLVLKHYNNSTDFMPFSGGSQYPNGDLVTRTFLIRSANGGFAFQKFNAGSSDTTVRFTKITFTQGDRGTLTLNSDGGNISGTHDFVVGLPLNLPIPSKTDMVFAGWYDGDSIIAVTATATVEMKNITLTAQWSDSISAPMVIVDFKAVDSTTNTTVTGVQNTGGSIEYTGGPEPETTGFEFTHAQGWGNDWVKFTVTLPDSVTLFAYDRITFDITYISGDLGYKEMRIAAGAPITFTGQAQAITAANEEVEVVATHPTGGVIADQVVSLNLPLDKAVTIDIAGQDIEFGIAIPAAVSGGELGGDTKFAISNFRLIQDEDIVKPTDPKVITDVSEIAALLYVQGSATKTNNIIGFPESSSALFQIDMAGGAGYDWISIYFTSDAVMEGNIKTNGSWAGGEGTSGSGQSGQYPGIAVGNNIWSYLLEPFDGNHFGSQSNNWTEETNLTILAIAFYNEGDDPADLFTFPPEEDTSSINISITDAFATNLNINLTIDETIGASFRATINFNTPYPEATLITYTWRINGTTVGNNDSLTYLTSGLNTVNYGTVIVTINGTPFSKSFEFTVK